MKTKLGTRDVAMLLDLSPDEVATAARKGDLKGSREGRQWRFTVKDVLRWDQKRHPLKA